MSASIVLPLVKTHNNADACQRNQDANDALNRSKPKRVVGVRANVWVQRARAVDSTQVKSAVRGLRLQPFVLQYLIIEFSFRFGPTSRLWVSLSKNRFGMGTRSLVTKILSWRDRSSRQKGLLRAFGYRLNAIDCLP